MNYDFNGKVILASGAASGMGYLACKRVVECGGSAVMCDINADSLSEAVRTVNEIREGSAIGVICDVRKYEDIENAKNEAVKAFGRIDVLAPFAGGAELRMLKVAEKDFCKVPIEVFDWSIDVNFRSQLYFDHAVLPVMIEQGSGRDIFRKGFQLHLKFGISLGRLQGKGTDAVVIHGACFNRKQGNVGSVRQFVSGTKGLLIETFPVRVVHALSGIL